MKRRTIIGAAILGSTAIAARAYGTRRRTTARTPAVRAPVTSRAGNGRPPFTLALLAFALLRTTFSISGPRDGIVDGVKGVASAVKDWVVDLLTSIFDFLWDWAVHIWLWVDGTFKELWKYARDLSDWSIRVINSVIDLVNRKFAEATNFAGWIVAELRNEMYAVISRAAGTVIDLVGFANRIIQDAYNLVAEKIYWPLWHLIQDVYGWVNTHVLQQVAGMIWGAINAAIGPLLALPGMIDDIWRWIWGTAMVAIDLVLKAKDFLLFVITHPFTWWLEYLNRIVDAAPEYIFRGVANTMERNAPTMEDWIVKAIGA